MLGPWVSASYLALRESFIADWKPTGSIELRLIEMMAQLYTAYEHWMGLSVQRVAFEHEREQYRIKENGKWRVMNVAADAEVNQAAEMADRFNRLLLRTLRQLRDLRRYVVPVTINNAEQVNIAAQGGQQVNMQQKPKRPKTKPHGTGRDDARDGLARAAGATRRSGRSAPRVQLRGHARSIRLVARRGGTGVN